MVSTSEFRQSSGGGRLGHNQPLSGSTVMRGRASLILVALASYAVDSSVDRGTLAPRLLRGGSEMMPLVSNSSLNASAAAEVAAGGAAMGSEVMAPPFPPFAEPDVGKETRGDAIRARVPGASFETVRREGTTSTTSSSS